MFGTHAAGALGVIVCFHISCFICCLPEFQLLRRAVQANPDILAPMLQVRWGYMSSFFDFSYVLFHL
jgi:hypothetical protein